MEFIYDICPVCGSKNIKVISKENVEEDTIYSYVCSSCNETFSSLSKRNKYIQKSKVETSNISNATNKKDAKAIFKSPLFIQYTCYRKKHICSLSTYNPQKWMKTKTWPLYH